MRFTIGLGAVISGGLSFLCAASCVKPDVCALGVHWVLGDCWLRLPMLHCVSKPTRVQLGFIGFWGVVGLRLPVPCCVSKPMRVHLEEILPYCSYPPGQSCTSLVRLFITLGRFRIV